jgi:GPI inositol-deacylase
MYFQMYNIQTVEFNEDLSAFHGPTLESQTEYTSAAIKYILSLYPTNTSILVLGHSMGGIVATSLLSPDTSSDESDRISAVITMSTPHVLPPARFDARVDKIYRQNRRVLMHSLTPILSICGGATDELVASESCVLPDPEHDRIDSSENGLEESRTPYRSTVFTSALEGAWTGVGHREMVWCHQVRWRVARAALELGGVGSGGAEGLKARTDVLDKWLTDGRYPPHLSSYAENGRVPSDRDEWRVLSPGQNMQWTRPVGGATYLFEPSASVAGKNTEFVLYVAQGSIGAVGPQHVSPLRASIYVCQSRLNRPLPEECVPFVLDVLKLVPSPVPGKPFPVPDEGSDESEGVIVARGKVPTPIMDDSDEEIRSWILVDIRDGDGSGWVAGGLVPSEVSRVESAVKTLGGWSILTLLVLIPQICTDDRHIDLVFGELRLELPTSLPLVEIQYPKLMSNALLVYRLVPEMSIDPSCQGASPFRQYPSENSLD